MTISKLLAASILALGVTAGCGDNDDAGDLAEFCAQLTQFDGQGPVPSDEELDRIAESAPEDIRSDVEAAASVLKAHGEDAIGEPTLGEHLDAIAKYRDANCEAS